VPQTELEIPSRSALWTALPAAIVLTAGLFAMPASAVGVRCYPDAGADSYVLSLGDNMTSTNLSVDEYVRLRERRTGDFLWFRRSGKSWLIEDRPTLEEARSLFASLRALEPEQADLERRQKALEEKERDLDREEEDLDRKMDQMSEDDEDDDDEVAAATPASDAELRGLQRRQDDLQARQRDLEARDRDLEKIESALEAREDAIEREAEAKLWNLIDAAVRNGLAKPSPMP